MSIVHLLTIALAIGVAEGRVWKDANGREFEAELIRQDGGDLIMQLPGGKRFTIKLDSLSPDDRVAAGGLRDPRKSNLGWNWPREARHDDTTPAKVVSEDPKAGRYVYETPHYRFLCNVKLTHDVVQDFSVLFETTYRYCQALPLAMEKQSPDGKRFNVLLFETEAQYVKAGGRAGSAGCHVAGRDLIMAPLSSLGLVSISGGYKLDRDRLNTVLIHELTHQLTPPVYFQPGARGWFSEGLAEYVATTPYSWGAFLVDPDGNAAKAYVTANGRRNKGGRGLGTTLSAPFLRHFMSMPYQEFTGKQATENYGLSLLLVHYFFHMDGQGRRARINAFLKALNAGDQGNPALEHLLDKRSYQQLEEDISSAWRAKGVTIRFGS